MATILLLSTADTELLAARAADAGYRTANPARIPPDDPAALRAELATLTDGADLVVLRLLLSERFLMLRQLLRLLGGEVALCSVRAGLLRAHRARGVRSLLGRRMVVAERLVERRAQSHGVERHVEIAAAGGLACRPADAQVGLPLADQPLASPKADAPTDPWAIEGAEKPAKKETHPVIKPHSGP